MAGKNLTRLRNRALNHPEAEQLLFELVGRGLSLRQLADCLGRTGVQFSAGHLSRWFRASPSRIQSYRAARATGAECLSRRIIQVTQDRLNQIQSCGRQETALGSEPQLENYARARA